MSGDAQGMTRYWQHKTPLRCPKGHRMFWLGGAFWLCPKEHCHQVYVAQWES